MPLTPAPTTATRFVLELMAEDCKIVTFLVVELHPEVNMYAGYTAPYLRARIAGNPEGRHTFELRMSICKHISNDVSAC
jgi:hypothetical protein